MPELSQTTIVVIVVAVLLLGVAIVMGRRLSKVTFKGPGGIAGSAEAGKPGSIIVRNVVEGDENKATAEGDNSTVSDNKVKGKGNVFGAKLGRIGKDDDPT